MQRPQSFNSIKLTTTNTSENDIILTESGAMLQINGASVVTSETIRNEVFSLKTVTSSSYTQESDYTHFLYDDDTVGSELSITLLSPSSHNLLSQHKKIGSTANVVINAPAGSTIDGSSSYTLDVQNEAIGLYTDGTNYFIQ